VIVTRHATSALTDPADPAIEREAVRARYARRQRDDTRYNLLTPAVLRAVQERQRAMVRLFAAAGMTNLSSARVLEVGCGTGANLLELLRFGVRPEHLQGIDLLPASVEQARRVLPDAVRVSVGDAADPDPSMAAPESQDIVYQATVFSSLLDDRFQQRLADAMWRCVRPGGGELWYDFTVNNPTNADVRGVPVSRIRQLFPGTEMRIRRVTLAPPLARIVTRVHPLLYELCNACVGLRTHVLAWIQKPHGA
jgi:SAM-dependent methyltransferase